MGGGVTPCRQLTPSSWPERVKDDEEQKKTY